MSLLLAFSTVSLQAASSPTDYTPAFIGLGGVIVGGLIQTGFSWMKQRDELAQAMRADVAKFCHEAANFSAHLQHFAKMARAGKLYEFSPEYRNKAADDLTQMLMQMRSAGYKLVAGTDQRIADQADCVTHAVITYSNQLSGIFARETTEPDQVYPDAAPVLAEINELATMVEPRIYERHARFRSHLGAKKLVAKQSRNRQL